MNGNFGILTEEQALETMQSFSQHDELRDVCLFRVGAFAKHPHDTRLPKRHSSTTRLPTSSFIGYHQEPQDDMPDIVQLVFF